MVEEDRKEVGGGGCTLETENIPHQLLFITQRQQITAQPLINYFSIITSSVKSVHD